MEDNGLNVVEGKPVSLNSVTLKRKGRPPGGGDGNNASVHFRVSSELLKTAMQKAGTGNISEVIRKALINYANMG